MDRSGADWASWPRHSGGSGSACRRAGPPAERCAARDREQSPGYRFRDAPVPARAARSASRTTAGPVSGIDAWCAFPGAAEEVDLFDECVVADRHGVVLHPVMEAQQQLDAIRQCDRVQHRGAGQKGLIQVLDACAHGGDAVILEIVLQLGGLQQLDGIACLDATAPVPVRGPVAFHSGAAAGRPARGTGETRPRGRPRRSSHCSR